MECLFPLRHYIALFFEVAPNQVATFSLHSGSTLVKSFSYLHDDSIITQNKPNLSEIMPRIILDHLHSDVPLSVIAIRWNRFYIASGIICKEFFRQHFMLYFLSVK